MLRRVVTDVLVQVGWPETSVTTNIRCVTSQKSEDLIYTAEEDRNYLLDVSLTCPHTAKNSSLFLLSRCQRVTLSDMLTFFTFLEYLGHSHTPQLEDFSLSAVPDTFSFCHILSYPPRLEVFCCMVILYVYFCRFYCTNCQCQLIARQNSFCTLGYVF
jgi:hypothetical protein